MYRYTKFGMASNPSDLLHQQLSHSIERAHAIEYDRFHALSRTYALDLECIFDLYRDRTLILDDDRSREIGQGLDRSLNISVRIRALDQTIDCAIDRAHAINHAHAISRARALDSAIALDLGFDHAIDLYIALFL